MKVKISAKSHVVILGATTAKGREGVCEMLYIVRESLERGVDQSTGG